MTLNGCEVKLTIDQLTENCKVYILEDLYPSGGKNVLNMCDLFEDDYKEFVLGKLTELCDS